MSKSPTAALSANLVAIKGMAAPAPDMPGRGAPAIVPQPAPPVAVSAKSTPLSTTEDEAEGKGGNLAPLNFRISPAFRREFKTYAAKHDLKLNELLRRCFEAYRREQGD